jgi:hypothetical protein
LHWNVEPASLERNAKRAVRDVVCAGGFFLIVEFGAVASTFHVQATAGPASPPESSAWT